jgi:hypothetical protein
MDSVMNEDKIKLEDSKYPLLTKDKSKGKSKPFFLSSQKIATFKGSQEINKAALLSTEIIGKVNEDGSFNGTELYVISPNVLLETETPIEETIFHSSGQPVKDLYKRLTDPVQEYNRLDSSKINNKTRIADILDPYIYQ